MTVATIEAEKGIKEWVKRNVPPPKGAKRKKAATGPDAESLAIAWRVAFEGAQGRIEELEAEVERLKAACEFAAKELARRRTVGLAANLLEAEEQLWAALGGPNV